MSPANTTGIPDAFWRDPVERAKADPAAFGELYDRYAAQIYRFVRSRVHDNGLAEDLTAEVFLNALRHIKSYRDQGRPFSCWLYRIAANAVASHYRSQRSPVSLDEQLDLAASLIDPLDEVVARERLRAVWKAVDRLPAQQRAAMILKFSDDLTMEDIATVLGKSSAAAKLLIYRAVQRLRCELAADREDPALRKSTARVMQASVRAAR